MTLKVQVFAAATNTDQYQELGKLTNCNQCGKKKFKTEENVLTEIEKEKCKAIFMQEGKFSLYRKKDEPTNIIAVKNDHTCKPSNDRQVGSSGQTGLMPTSDRSRYRTIAVMRQDPKITNTARRFFG